LSVEVAEIKTLYEQALADEKQAHEKVRALAYFIGKLNGLLTAVKMINQIVDTYVEETTKAAVEKMEAKRVFLESLPERKPEDYEKFSQEVKKINQQLETQKQAVKSIVKMFEQKVKQEAKRVRDKIKKEAEKAKDQDP